MFCGQSSSARIFSCFASEFLKLIAENDSEEKLQIWITEVLQALGDAKQTNEEIAASYKLKQGESHIAQAQEIPSKVEQKIYLTSCWIESLCTAEARFLGWVFQEIYGKAFQPNV